MAQIKILCFGKIEDIIQASEIQLEVGDTDSMNDYLLTRFPALKKQQYKIAVNQKINNENIKLNNGDQIAILPPFAGG